MKRSPLSGNDQSKRPCDRRQASNLASLDDCSSKFHEIDFALSKFTLLPRCFVAVAYMLTTFIGSTMSTKKLLDDFLTTFPCYSCYRNSQKHFDRIQSQLKSLSTNYPQIKSYLIAKYGSDLQAISKHTSYDGFFGKVDICPVCTAKITPDFGFTDLESQIESFYVGQLYSGMKPKDVYGLIDSSNVKIANSFVKRSNKQYEPVLQSISGISVLKSELAALKSSYDKLAKCHDDLKLELKKNLDVYSDNLKQNAALLHYGTRVSHRNISRINNTLFMFREPSLSLEDAVQNLPKIDTISPLESHGRIFDEYLNFVLKHHKEPNFQNLGGKHELHGPKGGAHRTSLSRYAQAICYNKLIEFNLQSENCEIFSRQIQPVLTVELARGKRKLFPLVDDLNIPSFPSLCEANTAVRKYQIDGKIVLGQTQDPIPVKTYDHFKRTEKTVHAYSRKVDLDKLRQHFLNKHTELGIMRAESNDYYKNLDRSNCLELLNKYMVHFEDSATESELSLTKLRAMVKDVETTRHFLIWWDHAELLNYTYVLFNFQLMYNPAVYKSDTMTERELQKFIETPQMYFMGISRSTTETEESYSPMRLSDLATLSANMVNKHGIAYKDVYKFTLGDTPARNSESGQNKGGHYPFATLPLHVGEFSDYYSLCKTKHMTIEQQRVHANKGGYYYDRSTGLGKNLGNNLQDKSKSIEIAKVRLGKTFSSQSAATEALKPELHGRRHHHTLLINTPHCNLSEHNLDQLEIMPAEPLHDAKGLSKKSFEYIPGSSSCSNDSHVLKIVKSVMAFNGDEDFLMKDNHSAETTFKHLVHITIDLEHRLFPGIDGLKCGSCGPLFALTERRKCDKCLFMGYYRSLLEIHIFCYKNHTKRHGQSILRLYNLSFLLFYFANGLIEEYPANTELSKVIHNVYFVNIVYYLPICFQLLSSLSYHAGRHEADFNDYKHVLNNFSNRHHFSENLLLNAERRIAVEKFFSETKITTSSVSQLITKLWETSPPIDVSFSECFINGDFHGFMTHLQRISCFIVSNNKNQFMTMSDSRCLVFPVRDCNCSRNDQLCISCISKQFPPFPIHNIFNSSIDKIIKINTYLYEQYIHTILKTVDNKPCIDLEALAKIVDKSFKSFEEVGGSTDVLAKVLHVNASETEKMDKLISLSVKSRPTAYERLEKSKRNKCLSIIYNSVTTDLMNLEYLISNMEHYQNIFSHDLDKLRHHEHYQEYLFTYIRAIRLQLKKLDHEYSRINREIDIVSAEVDAVIEDSTQESDFRDSVPINKLKLLQVKKLVLIDIMKSFRLESNAHPLVLDC